jgi:hypothetical protein
MISQSPSEKKNKETIPGIFHVSLFQYTKIRNLKKDNSLLHKKVLLFFYFIKRIGQTNKSKQKLIILKEAQHHSTRAPNYHLKLS